MRVVVTGGCGFIGSSFVNYLRKENITDILVIDKLTYAADPFSIPHEVPIIQKDICDITIDDIGYADYIVNFAAESHVDNSISNGLPFVKTNVEGTFNMLEVARKIPTLKKFIQISTDEVYGDMDSRGMASAEESTSLEPSSYYSATKAAADHLVESAGRTYGLPFMITRTCNNYGIHQHKEKFLPTIHNSIQNGKTIPLYGDGKNVREWIWVEDNVKLIYELMVSDQNGIWNIGSGERWTNKEIIEKISEIVGKDVNFTCVEDRKGHDRRYALNISKLEYYKQTFCLTSKTLEKYLKETFG